MFRLFFISFIILFISSCENKKNGTSFQKTNIQNIHFEIPETFSLKKSKSEDMVVYDIFSNGKSIGSIYFGSYYEPFHENYSITVEKEIYDKGKVNGEKIFLSDNAQRDYKNGIFNENYYYLDTINNKVGQIMLPKRSSKGLVGIYFDSIDIHKNKFAIISTDLSEHNKKIFLKIFKTIKIE
ncbi:hypothetical protein ACM46_15000 [Chryseobacterium angstadtii]|uniref:Lipoprotein n=1 Tax=Chryseobacterium angstadtii TaxID=558151 RepID=A0A0J7I4R4_9FLAO|nr:hypothetical protein [Chryseobacterium angstadtii]KMQ61342.1 hypothetical protein ACM46_15000 [Chryseobacterium angstadtii]